MPVHQVGAGVQLLSNRGRARERAAVAVLRVLVHVAAITVAGGLVLTNITRHGVDRLTRHVGDLAPVRQGDRLARLNIRRRVGNLVGVGGNRLTDTPHTVARFVLGLVWLRGCLCGWLWSGWLRVGIAGGHRKCKPTGGRATTGSARSRRCGWRCGWRCSRLVARGNSHGETRGHSRRPGRGTRNNRRASGSSGAISRYGDSQPTCGRRCCRRTRNGYRQSTCGRRGGGFRRVLWGYRNSAEWIHCRHI